MGKEQGAKDEKKARIPSIKKLEKALDTQKKENKRLEKREERIKKLLQ